MPKITVHKAENEHSAVAHAALQQEQETLDCVRARAYALFLERDGGPGNDKDDWLQAEREVLAAPIDAAKVQVKVKATLHSDILTIDAPKKPARREFARAAVASATSQAG